MTHAPHVSRTLRQLTHVALGVAIVCLVTRTWLVEGLIVPVVVSGSSMAEAYRGPHVRIECGACRLVFACDAARLPPTGALACPNCGFRDNRFDDDPADGPSLRRGDRLLVDRTAWLAGGPERWEPVVFRCPEQPGHYCVKRVVGLPGETIAILGGDVHVDGRPAVKTRATREAMALLVHDADHGRPVATAEGAAAGTAGAAAGWRSDGPHWHRDGSRFVCRPADDARAGAVRVDAPDDGPTDWLAWRHHGGDTIRDDYAYNGTRTQPLHTVFDRMLTCRLTPHGPGVLRVALHDGEAECEALLRVGESRIELRRAGVALATATLAAPPLVIGRPVELHWSRFDRQLLLAVDRQTLLTCRAPAPRGKKDIAAPPLRIGSGRLSLSVERLRVWRDIYYTAAAGPVVLPDPAPTRLGSAAYYLLGDNSPVSVDSRGWDEPGLPASQLVGRPLARH